MTDTISKIASELNITCMRAVLHPSGIRVEAPDGIYSVTVNGENNQEQIATVSVKNSYANLGQLIFATAEMLHLQPYHGRYLELASYNRDNKTLDIWVGS